MNITYQDRFYLNQYSSNIVVNNITHPIDIQLQIVANASYADSCAVRMLALSVLFDIHIDDIFTILAIIETKMLRLH
jgi:hypothetical protein